jgi:stress-induced morphogen
MPELRAYEPVVMFRTADGQIHATEKEAQEHAEHAAGLKLDALLCEASAEQLDSVKRHRIICHMLKNHFQYKQVFQALSAFDEEPET